MSVIDSKGSHSDRFFCDIRLMNINIGIWITRISNTIYTFLRPVLHSANSKSKYNSAKDFSVRTVYCRRM